MHTSAFTVIFVAQLISMLSAAPSSKNSNKIVRMPAVCKNQNYCTVKIDEEYPQNVIDNITSNTTTMRVPLNETENRQSTDPYDEVNPCRTESEMSEIYYIVDTNGDTRYVAQSQKLQQKFQITYCQNPGLMKNPQSPFDELSVCQFNVSCNDDLVPINFLVLSHDQARVELASIRSGLPMGCICDYTFPAPHSIDDCAPSDSDYDNDESTEHP